MRYVVPALIAAAACGRASGGTSSSVSDGKVTVNVVVLGPGVVRGGGLSADCRSHCSFEVPAGTTVHLLSVADAQAAFSGWSGPCSGTAACDLVVKDSVTVGANFAGPQDLLPPMRRLDVSISGAGSVRSDPAGIDCAQACAASFADRTRVTLTAVPAPGWAFVGFTGGCSGTNCAFSIEGEAQVTATFAQRMAVLSVDLAGSGTVRSTPAGIDCPRVCSATFAADTDVVLTATAEVGFAFAGFSGLCSGAACSMHLSADGRVSAAFAPIPMHQVTVVLSGSGAGRVTSAPPGIDCPGTCAASFRQGSAVSFLATPDPLSRFAAWKGACAGSICTITVQADTAAVAQFDNRRYVVMDLGVGAGDWWSGASAISPNGKFIAGNTGGPGDAFLWDGVIHPVGHPWSSATGVNDAGVLAGTFQYDTANGAAFQAFRWRAGVITPLEGLGGPTTFTAHIGGDGAVVGWAVRADGQPRATVWKANVPIDLGSLGGGFSACSLGFGGNAAGVVVGQSCTDTAGAHPVRFRAPGVIDDLGTFGGNYGAARAINDAGVIVGEASEASGIYRGFVYQDGHMIDAGTLPGMAYSQLFAIDEKGIAVGLAFSTTGVQRAVVWAAGRMIDLNTLVDGSPYTLNSMAGIDEAGDIVGSGLDNGISRAVVLRPRD